MISRGPVPAILLLPISLHRAYKQTRMRASLFPAVSRANQVAFEYDLDSCSRWAHARSQPEPWGAALPLSKSTVLWPNDLSSSQECWHPPLGCCPVAQWRLTLCNPMDCSTPGFPVHYLPESGPSTLVDSYFSVENTIHWTWLNVEMLPSLTGWVFVAHKLLLPEKCSGTSGLLEACPGSVHFIMLREMVHVPCTSLNLPKSRVV